MQGTRQWLDTVLGICNHGAKCCPHTVVGKYPAGSPNVKGDAVGMVRVGDYCTTSCPHCGMGIAGLGSQTVKANGRNMARIADNVVLGSGMGQNTTGKHNLIIKG